jgi:choice-of-anchor B domain-containing protein
MLNFLLKNLLTIILSIACYSSVAQKNIDFRANYQYNVRLSGLWGYTAPDNKEYAVVGLTTGVSIVDVSNPDNPQQVAFVSGPQGIWREMKTYGEYAYVTNETDSGLLIINLSQLPSSVSWQYWTGGGQLRTAHTIFIDENGIAYLNGFNNGAGDRLYDDRGFMMLDLNQNPEDPTILGIYENDYVHDCFVRNDTAWASEISQGWFSVIDVSDKANPILIATKETPSRFTHNTWLSDDGNYLFTTDERAGAFVASYDVSDIDNIKELDRYQSTFASQVIPHNVRVLGNYLVVAAYKDGVTIVDASHPDHLIEVGNFDTSPFLSEDGFSGCWDVYPYFPSGTIIASDIEEGLFVLTPTYTPAAYLEGKITNASTGFPIQSARVEFIGNNWFDFSNISGDYKTGIADSGNYSVRVFANGCTTKVIGNVTMQQGVINTLNVALDCPALTSVNDHLQDKNYFVAAPNMFNDFSSVKYELSYTAARNAQFTITDVSGKIVDEFKPQNTVGREYFGRNLHAGIYFITLQANEIFQTIKVIKTH